MNILSVFVSFAILLKCVAASEEGVGVGFKEAVDGENFGWLKANSERWKERRDLLDYVIAKGADVTVWFIQSVGALAKTRVLAALFDEGEAMIDDVLGGIEYDDGNLCLLTDYRPELAASHEKFFRVLDKIEDPGWQEMAVREGVKNLFEAGRHDLVVPLVNALGEKTFKSKRLKDVAIQVAFYGGTIKGNQYFVELYCEHPAVTSEIYAHGLCQAWNGGEPNQVFPFLLEQADQGDLDMVKEKLVDEYYEKFRQAIDKTPETAPPAGSRHLRPIERTVSEVLASITEAPVGGRPSGIIRDYLLGEKEKTKEGESEGQESGAKNRTD